jgi:nitrogen fixation-related uncharacterized protein
MKGFAGLKLWPNATGNILMLISIILIAIIVIWGLVWGFTSENFTVDDEYLKKLEEEITKKM